MGWASHVALIGARGDLYSATVGDAGSPDAYKPRRVHRPAMSASDVRDVVTDRKATELSRLGSSKSLYAATGGEMETEAVLRAAADTITAAADVLEDWADREADADAADAYEATAGEARDHAETVLAELDGYDPDPSDEGLAGHLAGVEGTAARAGAFLGYVLVTDEATSQYVGYFVGNADPQTASVFRGIREDVDAQEEQALDLLDAVCETDEDYEAAEAAALGAVQAAYDEHVGTLEALGVDPKPVC